MKTPRILRLGIFRTGILGMGILGILGIFVFVFLWASAASAAIYSWTDKDGRVHFTNFAPPPQARLIIKDSRGDEGSGTAMQTSPRKKAGAPEAGQKEAVNDRLKKAEARVGDLEKQVNQAQEKAKALEQDLAEAHRKAQEQNLAEARRKVQEAQEMAQEASGSDGESEVDYISPPYYGGYVYGAVPYGRPFIDKKGPRGFHHRRDLHKKGSHRRQPADYTSSRGRRDSFSGAVSNDARTQDNRNFEQSRINPLENNFVNRHQVTEPRARPHYSK